MVYISFPPTLTEEEEVLRQKYARLRKKRKQLQALKALKPEKEPVKEKPAKRPAESAEDAKEQAKKLLMSGAIKISDKNQEKKGFKKSRNLEKKRQDPEKAPAAVGFQPFSSSHPEDERDERDERGKGRPRGRGLYDSFVRGDRVPGSERDDDRRRDDRREREPLPKKGNTVYVYGHSVTEEILRKALNSFGNIAIKISDKNQEKKGFKKSRNLEKKRQDPEKAPAAVGFQPFSSSHPEDERDERDERGKGRPRGRGLYDSFVRGDRVPGSERDDDRRRDDRREREPLPKKGNTVYVYGHSVTEEILRKALNSFGNIVNVSMETEKHCGFVTFDKMESADSAIQQADGAMIDGVQLRVSMARRQPSFEQPPDASTTSWAQIASSNSQKGSHKDKRDIVNYETDDIF